jgi:diaminopimelate epimerase
MRFEFFKYQATGNDFVILDNRDRRFHFSINEIRQICDRKFGVGADGLMLIEPHDTLDFNLQYYNSDGSQSLCGNGSRAAMSLASKLGLVNGSGIFNAFDGAHEAQVITPDYIRLKMGDVHGVKRVGDDLTLNTGSPHYIKFVPSAATVAVYELGKSIRYSEPFAPGGINVNFVELQENNTIFVRTYERGVEDETLSCGTGVTAAALAASFHGYRSPVKIKTLGGELSVDFKVGDSGQNSGQPDTFHDIHLSGPAKMVFKGELEL